MSNTGPRTGHGKPLCGSRRRQGEGTCRQGAGARTDHQGTGSCWLHGGSTTTHRTAATREVVRREIAEAVEILGADPIADPLRALQELAGQVWAWKNALAARVDLDVLRYESNVMTEQTRGEVQMLERAMDRCNTVLATIARLNIDERLAAIDEATAVMLVRAVEAGLAAVGVTGPAADQARQVVSRHLRLAVEGERS